MPGINGYFLFDDAISISQNPYLAFHQLNFGSLWQSTMSSSAGMFKRPLSMLTFALDYAAWGMSPLHFKYTNIVIHLLNGICVYLLTKLILDVVTLERTSRMSDVSITLVSLGTSASWLLHPINLTGVLYLVQRMASLSALFVFIGMIAFIYGRKKLLEGSNTGFLAIISAFVVFTPLAVLSKENGALLPLMILLIEIVILKWDTKTARDRKLLISIFCIFVFLPLLAGFAYIAINPGVLTATYPIREFTMSERLMTESRVLWFYLRLILVPDLTSFGFYHDDIAISKSLFHPYETIIAILGLIVLTTSAIVFRKKFPLFSFGVFFFLIGHALESSVFALELVFEHRNYLPSFGILLPLMYYLVSPDIHTPTKKLRRIIAFIFLLIFATITYIRAHDWGNPLQAKLMEVEHHPNSVRANADLGFLYGYMPARSQEEAQKNFDLAISHFQKAVYLSDTSTLGLFGLIQTSLEHHVPVDISWWNELALRLENTPFPPANANSMVRLKKCYSEGECKFDGELLEKLIHACLKNPTLSGDRKSAILFIWASYLYETKHLPEEAEKAAYEGVQANPGKLTDRIFLVTFLDALGKPKQAFEALEIAKKMDKLGTFSSTITELESDLKKKIGNTD